MALNKNDLNQYQEFVDTVTSATSKNTEKLVDRLEFSRANFTAAKDWVKG